jgi:hypothetical protein
MGTSATGLWEIVSCGWADCPPIWVHRLAVRRGWIVPLLTEKSVLPVSEDSGVTHPATANRTTAQAAALDIVYVFNFIGFPSVGVCQL